MDITEFDRDTILTDFLADYLDGNLNQAETRSFKAYLAQNDKERTFARKAMQGKKALSRLADHIKSSTRDIDTSSLTAIDTH